MTFFDTAKTGIFLDAIGHSTETRRGDETKIIVLALRIDPFDSKLAISLDQRVRQTLFRLNDGEPWPHLRRSDFALGVELQNLRIFEFPEATDESLLLTQVKIAGVYARVQKDANAYTLHFKASFGPPGRDELLFVEDWRNNQKWITFEQSEPALDTTVDETPRRGRRKAAEPETAGVSA